MKKAQGEIWIDGFNLLYRWRETAALFQPGSDIVTAQELGLRLLSRRLGVRRGRCLVFMDGGVRRESLSADGLRVRYPGPGAKADDLLEEALRAREGRHHRDLTVVSSDRVLAADLRRQGARIMTAEEFITGVLQAAQPVDRRDRPVDRERTRPLSEGEVDYWLREFGEDPDESVE